jgi:hypothetical protein
MKFLAQCFGYAAGVLAAQHTTLLEEAPLEHALLKKYGMLDACIMCVPKLVTDRYVNDGVPLVARQQIPARSNWAESHRALACLDGLIFDVAGCSGASLAKHPQRQVSNLTGRDALVQDQRA